MKVNERRTVVGGLIGHCVSPQPWREIDAHGQYTGSVASTLKAMSDTTVSVNGLPEICVVCRQSVLTQTVGSVQCSLAVHN